MNSKKYELIRNIMTRVSRFHSVEHLLKTALLEKNPKSITIMLPHISRQAPGFKVTMRSSGCFKISRE